MRRDVCRSFFHKWGIKTVKMDSFWTLYERRPLNLKGFYWVKTKKYMVAPQGGKEVINDHKHNTLLPYMWDLHTLLRGSVL